jgi:hypothetical protein
MPQPDSGGHQAAPETPVDAAVARLDRFTHYLDSSGGAFLAAMGCAYSYDASFGATVEALSGDIQLVVAAAKEAQRHQ